MLLPHGATALRLLRDSNPAPYPTRHRHRELAPTTLKSAKPEISTPLGGNNDYTASVTEPDGLTWPATEQILC